MHDLSGGSRRDFLVLAGSVVVGLGACRQAGSSGAVSVETPAAPRTLTPAPTPTPTPTPTPPALDLGALERELDRYLADRPERLTLAFHERVSGLTFRYRPRLRGFAASCVKVHILVALLLQAQADDRRLTPEERTLAEQAITWSDNRATNIFWGRIGGRSGLAAVNRRLGLRSTTPPASVYWGRTLTSAADQVRLLRSLVRGGSPLHTTNRRYVLGLMRDVVPEQRWGVSAAARDGDVVALKNGWLPTVSHGGLWVIDSIGRVRGPHRDLLIAVLSDHNPSSQAGIRTVERAVELVAERLP